MAQGPSLSFIKSVIYKLKRSFGLPMTLIYDTTTTDLATGKKIVTKLSWTIRQAILMPEKLDRQSIFAYFIKTQFKYGSELTLSDRIVLIDARDLKLNGLEIVGSTDWYAIFNNKRFQVIHCRQYESGAAFVLTIRELKGAQPYRVVEITVHSNLKVTQEIQQ